MERDTRNLTLHLPADLIRKAKVYAAERDTSINILVKDFLDQTVSGQDRVRAAGGRILEMASRGPHSAVDPASIRREESMNAGKAFFDSNVLLYMHSTVDLRKQALALQVFEKCLDSGRPISSTQVVQEFHAAGLRKMGMPLDALRELTEVLLDLPLVEVRPSHIRKALWGEEHYKISFWDALILAAADSAGAEVLYTEDLNDGQDYWAVRVESPFRVVKDR